MMGDVGASSLQSSALLLQNRRRFFSTTADVSSPQPAAVLGHNEPTSSSSLNGISLVAVFSLALLAPIPSLSLARSPHLTVAAYTKKCS
ncbi:hypothetical protein LINPERHAP2_LOCUS887 [Linum perenne]